MNKNPFSFNVSITGQAQKLFDQLYPLTTEQAQELLAGGYFAALRHGKMAGTLPAVDELGKFLTGRYQLVKSALWLDCSKPFDIASMGEGWKIFECDDRSLALASVNFTQAQFISYRVQEYGKPITYAEHLRLLKEEQPNLVRLGGKQYQALWSDYKLVQEDSALEWLRLNKKITYLDFVGLILQRADYKLCVLSLYFADGQWHDGYSLLDAKRYGDTISICLPAP